MCSFSSGDRITTQRVVKSDVGRKRRGRLTPHLWAMGIKGGGGGGGDGPLLRTSEINGSSQSGLSGRWKLCFVRGTNRKGIRIDRWREG